MNGVDKKVNWPPKRDFSADVSSVSPSSKDFRKLLRFLLENFFFFFFLENFNVP